MNRRRRLVSVAVGIAVCAVLVSAPGPFSAGSRADDPFFDPAKPPERRFAFSMQAKPWNQVFEWLSHVTGQPVVAASVPTGTFTFVSPKDRTYTLGELVDAVNDGLQGAKFVLIRRPGSWLVVPAEQRLDPTLILQMRPDELPSRGKSEVVRIVLPLEGTETKDALAVVKSMLGPLGNVLPLGNRLLITDGAGNLQQITRVLYEAEVVKGSAKASSALKTAVVTLTTLDALGTVKMLGGLYATERNSGLAFEADVSRNAVVVRGSKEQVEEILGAIKALGDTGTLTGGQRVITLESGSAATLAEELSKMLQKMGKNPVQVIVPEKPPTETKPPVKEGPPPKSEADKLGPPVRLIGMGSRLIAMSDDAQALLLVQQLVKLYTDPMAAELKVVRLKHGSASSIARVLDQAFNDRVGPAKPERLRVVADPAGNALLVKATPLDLLMIEKLISQTLDVVSGREENVLKMYILPLRHAQAAVVAKVMSDLHPVKTITFAAEARTNSLMLRCNEVVLQDVKKMVEVLDVKPEKPE